MVWPLALPCLLRQPTRVASALFAAAMMASFGLNLQLSVLSDGAAGGAAYYFPLARFWEIGIGAAVAWISQDGPSDAGRWMREGVALLGAALLAVGVAVTTKDMSFPGWIALLPTIGTALLIYAGVPSECDYLLISIDCLSISTDFRLISVDLGQFRADHSWSCAGQSGFRCRREFIYKR